MLPGGFFIFWSIWTIVGVARLYLRSSVRSPYETRSWHENPWGGKAFPGEPVLKMLFPFIGILGELWIGHDTPRYCPQSACCPKLDLATG